MATEGTTAEAGAEMEISSPGALDWTALVLKVLGILGLSTTLGCVCGFWLTALTQGPGAAAYLGWAFILTGLFLLIGGLPSGIVGVLGIWLHRRSRARPLLAGHYLAFAAAFAFGVSVVWAHAQAFPH